MSAQTNRSQPIFAVFCLLLLAGPSARAADTVETFEPGMSDMELYLAHDGLGRDSAEQAVAGEMVLGVGLTPRLSAYISTVQSSNPYFTEGVRELGIGLFGTVRDGDHVDLDLMLDLRTLHDGASAASVHPSLELNWDAAPDLARWGLYARTGLALSGETTDLGPRRIREMDVTLGFYRTLGAGRQLLLEYDWNRCDAAGCWEQGSLVAGFNAELVTGMELISQVGLGTPGAGASGVGFLFGLIRSL
ncbi:MAG TPA: hypothetical protein P5571_04495 [Candidatus Krumholzibacteria bacterium]|nr:hypothetical protein [Candidatus Krumholzibacteria bacterium]HRX50600.1 hypothetical protein [Candidatus Krumholzibacteria bacterium]